MPCPQPCPLKATTDGAVLVADAGGGAGAGVVVALVLVLEVVAAASEPGASSAAVAAPPKSSAAAQARRASRPTRITVAEASPGLGKALPNVSIGWAAATPCFRCPSRHASHRHAPPRAVPRARAAGSRRHGRGLPGDRRGARP